MKFVFLGSSVFSVFVLEALLERGFSPTLILTQPDRPKGRGQKILPTPVKTFAEKKNFPVRTDLAVFEARPPAADFYAIAAFGALLKSKVLETPRRGVLNVHPSLLPRYRGPAPIQAAILNGDRETGVTVMLTDEKMDHGPILAQKILPVEGGDTYLTLEEKLGRLGGKLLAETIPPFLAEKLPSRAQDHTAAVYSELIKKSDGLVDPAKDPPQTIERKVRAYTPWPGVYFFSGGRRILITKASLVRGALKIERVKPAGEKEISWAAFTPSPGVS